MYSLLLITPSTYVFSTIFLTIRNGIPFPVNILSKIEDCKRSLVDIALYKDGRRRRTWSRWSRW